MPTIIKELTLSLPRQHPTNHDDDHDLTDVLHEFLQVWLFEAGYSLSKPVESAPDIQRGTVMDTNLGGLLWIVSNIDRRAGLLEYQMDPQTNVTNGPVLTSCRGEITITEQEDTNEQQPESTTTTTTSTTDYLVIWKLDFTVSKLLNVLSWGVTRASTKQMLDIVMQKDLDRIQQHDFGTTINKNDKAP